ILNTVAHASDVGQEGTEAQAHSRGRFMPPRSSPPPAGKPRRRPAPVMPGSWIWLVLLGALVVLMIFHSLGNTPRVEFSEFLKLVYSKEDVKYIKKITIHGDRGITVELDYDRKPEGQDTLPSDLAELRAKKLHGGNKFTTGVWPLEDPGLAEKLRQLST